MKKSILLLGVAAFITTTLSFRLVVQEDPWKVPEKYEKLKNPVPADEASIASGKELYNYFCLSCHGNDGKGSGKRALKLDQTPTDFTSEVFQRQSDGALLFKIYSGHNEMPAFKKRMPGNQDAMEGSFGKTRIPGDIVNYVRTFGQKTNHVQHP
ncbi:MAG TPA: c-type cytochrome [Chitinophagaceae bacterium]|nr:c-type cytochrome [Chitinophagaceae bacterium]